MTATINSRIVPSSIVKDMTELKKDITARIRAERKVLRENIRQRIASFEKNKSLVIKTISEVKEYNAWSAGINGRGVYTYTKKIINPEAVDFKKKEVEARVERKRLAKSYRAELKELINKQREGGSKI
jgi:hypothetical protein